MEPVYVGYLETFRRKLVDVRDNQGCVDVPMQWGKSDLIVINGPNGPSGDLADNKSVPARLLCVWRGSVLNGGESSLSSFAWNNKTTLETVCYAPLRTKGGVFIRPLYYRGDRGGNAEFPALRMLVLGARVFPHEYGWICRESLECLVYVSFGNMSYEIDARFLKLLLSQGTYKSLRCVLFCPVTVETNLFTHPLAPTIVAYPPIDTPWAIRRLLWLGRSPNSQSPFFSQLPKDIIRKICSYLKCDWRIISY